MTKEEIGAILKSARIQNGKTQKQVAEALGRTQQIIGHWETGYSQPDANTLFTICDLYGISIDDTFGFKDNPTLIIDAKQSFSVNEHQHIKKYRKLDAYGKEMVDMVLDKECARVSGQHKNEETSTLRLVGRDGSSITKEVNTADTDAIFAQLDGKETKDDF